MSPDADRSYPFIDLVSRQGVVLHFGDAPGIEHPDCSYRAEVYPDLDAFFCRYCQWNGRISGAWFMDLLSAEPILCENCGKPMSAHGPMANCWPSPPTDTGDGTP